MLRKAIRHYSRDVFWRVYGKTLRNPEISGDRKSFLFVCKGNICRSPFAEYLSRTLMSDRTNGNLTFFSAGLEVSVSKPSPKEALLTAEKLGVDLGLHRSRQLDRGMMECYDNVLAMDGRQFRALRRNFPQYQQKIYLLPLFESHQVNEDNGYARYNIPDPFGGDIEDYKSCFVRIKGCVEKLFDRMEVK
jgi:protein-tyrosine phosphatase